MEYFVYILSSEATKKSYVGISDNVERRVLEHNAGKSFYTKKYAHWKLIYVEKVKNRLEARSREQYFKSGIGRTWMKHNLQFNS